MLLLIVPKQNNAQDSTVVNEYFIKYPKKLMVRVYLAQKFAPLTISSASKELSYNTNTKLNLGAGVSYRGFTLNLSYGFKFLNKEKGGKTTGLDLQLNLFPEKWVIDLLGSYRKGFYLDPKNNSESGLALTNYYHRPDIQRNITGLSVFRVANANKFSYRAAITQNEQQIKSAGSLLFGGNAYFGMIKGDSTLVPSKVSSSFEQAGVDKVSFVSIGPGIGYAYTLVSGKFFITGSAIATADVNFSNEETAGSQNKQVTVTPGAIYKAALGFNSSDWSVTANIVGNALYVGSKVSEKEYFLPTGIMRFIIARKFGN
jgi:hypothetical protein